MSGGKKRKITPGNKSNHRVGPRKYHPFYFCEKCLWKVYGFPPGWSQTGMSADKKARDGVASWCPEHSDAKP